MTRKKKLIYTDYGMYTIGGITKHFSISFAGHAVSGWRDFYKNKAPWTKWFSNPIFHNRSGHDLFLNRYRVWFILFWFIIRA